MDSSARRLWLKSGHVSQVDITSPCWNCFEKAKTFGSLIQIPHLKVAAKLPQIEKRLEDVLKQYGDLTHASGSMLIKPLFNPSSVTWKAVRRRGCQSTLHGK